MKKHSLLKLLILSTVLLFFSASSEAIKYRFEDLGHLNGTHAQSFYYKEADINESGTVVGWVYVPGELPGDPERKHAFVKSPGKEMVDLGALTPPGSTDSYAFAIDDAAKVGGYYVDDGGTHACFWIPSGTAYTFEEVGGSQSRVYDLNNDGYLSGSALSGSSSIRAFVRLLESEYWELPMLAGNTAAQALGINSSRVAVGYQYGGPITYSCIWFPSDVDPFYTVEPLFGDESFAYSVNNAGVAVGFQVETGASHAFIKAPGELPQDIGNLGGIPMANAYDINDSNWVVGLSHDGYNYHAFLWTPDKGMRKLHDLIVNLPEGVRLTSAFAINNKGEIAGYTDNNKPYRLVPFADPPLPLLLLDD